MIPPNCCCVCKLKWFSDNTSLHIELSMQTTVSNGVHLSFPLSLKVNQTSVIGICPGFVVSTEDQSVPGDDNNDDDDDDTISLVSLGTTHFGTGQFVIENEPTSEHRVKIHVRVTISPYQIDFLLLGLQIKKSDQGGR